MFRLSLLVALTYDLLQNFIAYKLQFAWQMIRWLMSHIFICSYYVNTNVYFSIFFYIIWHKICLNFSTPTDFVVMRPPCPNHYFLCLIISSLLVLIYFSYCTVVVVLVCDYDVGISYVSNLFTDCLRRNTRLPMGKYGEHSCDSPWSLITSAAQTMKEKYGDNIEFVLWTGWVRFSLPRYCYRLLTNAI